MSFARMLVATGYVCALASQAHAQLGGNPMELKNAMEQKGAFDACEGKTVDAACTYQGKTGKCFQPAPRIVGYGAKIPSAIFCDVPQQQAATPSLPPPPLMSTESLEREAAARRAKEQAAKDFAAKEARIKERCYKLPVDERKKDQECLAYFRSHVNLAK